MEPLQPSPASAPIGNGRILHVFTSHRLGKSHKLRNHHRDDGITLSAVDFTVCYQMLFTTLHGHPSLQACELGTSIAPSFGWETQVQEGRMTFSQPAGRAVPCSVALPDLFHPVSLPCSVVTRAPLGAEAATLPGATGAVLFTAGPVTHGAPAGA